MSDPVIEGDGAVFSEHNERNEYDDDDVSGGVDQFGKPLGFAAELGGPVNLSDDDLDDDLADALGDSEIHDDDEADAAYERPDEEDVVYRPPVASEGIAFSSQKKKRSAAPPKLKRVIAVRYVTGDKRRTTHVMTRFERARIIGIRAKEIENNAMNIDDKIVKYVESRGIDGALDIAEIELEDTSVPFPLTILRPIAVGIFEVWPVRDLLLPSEVLCSSYSPEATGLILTDGDFKRSCASSPADALFRSYTRYAS